MTVFPARIFVVMCKRKLTVFLGATLLLSALVALHYSQRTPFGFGNSLNEQEGLVRFVKPTSSSYNKVGILQSTAKNSEDMDQSSWVKELYRMGVPFVSELNRESPYKPTHRIIHLDLKGAPPKISYLLSLLPILRQMGATGILMEYEDMMPLEGNLRGISAKNAYSQEEIQKILDAAKENQLKIIPLVQTFGHLEFALKGRDFMTLREVPDSPQALCPSLNQSLVFVEDLITQVMKLHENYDELTHLHIGCDEVFQLGECPRCRNSLREDLFLNHVTAVANIIRKRWPHVKPIIWDDMLRHISQPALEASHIGTLVEPMVWVYATDVYRFVSTQIWEKYAAVFPTAWTSSAYKGAHGETLVVPPARKHLENTVRWLGVMSAESSRFSNGISGIVLTGWQRYDHFAVLCELLPAALPSLALCLTVTTYGILDTKAKDAILKGLSCKDPLSTRHPFIDLNSDPNMYSSFGRCLFPGNEFFRLVQRLESNTAEALAFIETTTNTRAWMTDYNLRRNYSSPFRVDELMTDSSRIMNSLTNIIGTAGDVMKNIYDVFTIYEWLEQRVYPIVRKLKDLENSAKILKEVKVWDVRPLPYLRELQRFGLTQT